MTTATAWKAVRAGFLVAGLTVVVACGGDAPAGGGATATPVYNAQTGRLEELVSDRDGDGVVETRAFMEGTRIVRIEIDRNGDGRVDRWEHYVPNTAPPPASLIATAEEAAGADGRVTRRETYVAGELRQVEEDADLDGRMDKWEIYENGRVSSLSMDLTGAGKPTRRLVYTASGGIARVEADEDGDGVFEAAAAP